MAGQYDLQLDPKFKKMAFDLNEPNMDYKPSEDLSILQTKSAPSNDVVEKDTPIGTPGMMAAAMAMQLLDERMAAPYKEMSAKQLGEENRRAKQENALVNLQNISKMYGNL